MEKSRNALKSPRPLLTLLAPASLGWPAFSKLTRALSLEPEIGNLGAQGSKIASQRHSTGPAFRLVFWGTKMSWRQLYPTGRTPPLCASKYLCNLRSVSSDAHQVVRSAGTLLRISAQNLQIPDAKGATFKKTGEESQVSHAMSWMLCGGGNVASE